MAETIANNVGALRAISQMLRTFAITSEDQDQRAVLLAAMEALGVRIRRELERPLPLLRNLQALDMSL